MRSASLPTVASAKGEPKVHCMTSEVFVELRICRASGTVFHGPKLFNKSGGSGSSFDKANGEANGSLGCCTVARVAQSKHILEEIQR